jgi:hypothetical protein
MLKYFNSGYFSRTLMLTFMAALLWLPAFLTPAKPIIPQHPAPLYQLFLWLSASNAYLQLAIAFILTITSALLLNQIATEFEITEKISQLGTLIYILFSGAMVHYTSMNSMVIVNLLMLFLLHSLFKVSESKEPIPLTFNASFILGIVSLVYLPALLFILLLWVALMIFRVSQWRNFIVSLVGLILPFIFVFTWYFWYDETSDAYALLFSSLAFHLPVTFTFSPGDWAMAIILLVFTLVSVIQTSKGLMEKNINIRQILIVTMYYLAIAVALILFFSKNSASSLLLSVPASLLLASVFSEIKNTKWFERALRLLLLLALLNQYTRLFYAA